MTVWQPQHAAQVLAAREVLRGCGSDAAPADVLYQTWYAARSPQPAPSRPWDAPVASSARAAHQGAGDWSPDESEVVATGIAGVVVVATPRGRRALCRGDYLTTSGRPGFPPRVGDRVRMVRRLGALVQDGWWRTWGEGWDVKHPQGPLDRVYLRPAPCAVAPLVQAVTGVLAQTDSWMFKLAPTSDGLSRPDAAVAYIGGPAREEQRGALVAAVAGLTRGAPPALTEQVGDGIGWAQDPGTGESFGEVRCAAIATAYASMTGEEMSQEKWLTAVAGEFRSRGIDPAAPHRSGMTVEVPR